MLSMQASHYDEDHRSLWYLTLLGDVMHSHDGHLICLATNEVVDPDCVDHSRILKPLLHMLVHLESTSILQNKVVRLYALLRL